MHSLLHGEQRLNYIQEHPSDVALAAVHICLRVFSNIGTKIFIKVEKETAEHRGCNLTLKLSIYTHKSGITNIRTYSDQAKVDPPF